MEFASNVEIYEDKNFATLEINPEIFSLEVIYSAAYTFLDKAYFMFEGDPEEEIILKLKPKKDSADLEEMVYNVQNELVNYAVYVIQASRNQQVRNAIISRALYTNGVEYHDKEQEERTGEDLIVEDEKGIAETWSPEKEEGIEEIDDSENISSSWQPEDDSSKDFESEEKKVSIDQDKCTECGTCRTLAPESFELDEYGRTVPSNQEIDENTKKASKACPVDAITLKDQNDE